MLFTGTCARSKTIFGFIIIFIAVIVWQRVSTEEYSTPTSTSTFNLETRADPETEEQKVSLPPSNFGNELEIDSIIKEKEVVETKKDDDFLDFYIAGFPKCGTSSMMDLFRNVVNETVIILPEQDSPNKREYNLSDLDKAQTLVDKIKEISKTYNKTMKFGIKWPIGILFPSSFRNLIEVDKRHENTKIIIGLRHPVKFFESYYNYRMNKHPDTIPPANSLIGGIENSFYNVYTGLAQYERYFMQFGKVDLSADELGILSTPLYKQKKSTTALVSIPNKIFLYTLEQFKDENVTRVNGFYSDLTSFLELEKPLTSDMLPKSNIADKQTDKKARFDICDDANKKVRKILVRNAKETANWFQTRLSKEIADVTIGGRDHFFTLLETWKVDPCIVSLE